MNDLINKILFLNIDPQKISAVKDDIHEENRRCTIIYSSIMSGGMFVLFLASFFISVLVSSRIMYEMVFAIGIVLLFVALGPARKHQWLTIICQYALIAASDVIRKNIGQYGQCYRIGGDEFMAFLEGDHPAPAELIKNIDRDAAAYYSRYGFDTSISSGIVEGDSSQIDVLISQADAQMYQHKYEFYVTSGYDRRARR